MTKDGRLSAKWCSRLRKKMPSALVDLERVGDEGAGRVRLTLQGKGVLDEMAWL